MLQIMCWLDAEDYMYINSISEQKIPVDYYGYTFEVSGSAGSTEGSSTVRLVVVELINVKMTVGF